MRTSAQREILHLLSAEQLADVWVSRHSRWSDQRWYFDNPTAGQRPTKSAIRWDFELPDGSRFTDPRWAALLDSARRLIWSLHVDPRQTKPWKPGSLLALSVHLRYLVRWMVRANYASLGELDTDAGDEFVAYLIEDKVAGDNDDDGLSADALAPYLTLWNKIDFQGPVLRAMGIDPMPEPPFHGRPTFEVARDLARAVSGQIPAVPDGAFLAVTQAVIRWLDIPAKDILLLQQAYLDDYAADRSGLRNGPRHDISAKLRSSRQVLKAFRFSTPPGAAGPWHEPIAYQKTRVGGSQQSLALNSVQQLRRLVLGLRDACVIAVQAFVGMRISEVCGLQAYPLDPKTGLPACVEIRPSRSGLYDVFYVKGRLFKTTDDWQEVTWVAGLRWRGTTYLPPPIQALIVLERLFRPWRDLGGRSDLIVSLAHGWGLPKRATTIGAIPSDALVEGQRDWIAQNVELPPEFADWRVTSHQWRKSFAVYMIRTDSRMLPAVSQHFKHVSLAMTEQGYLGNDVELLGVMEDTATRETARMLCELATGQTAAGGKMAEVIRERTAEIETHLAGKSAPERLAEMERLVRSTDVRAWSCEWGWCFFRPETARCWSRQSSGRMKAVRPNEAVRNPGLCCECANLATTREHVPFWLSRRDQWKTILTEHQRAGLEEFALVARDRVKQCNSVLRLMGIDPPALGGNHAA